MKSSVPLYHHLKAQLLSEMESGLWKPEDLIPSEPELAKQYQISRTTVRQAIGDLVSSGYLVRKQGRGTFVVGRSNQLAASRLYGFVEELRHRGCIVDVKLLEASFQTCPERVATKLQISTDTPVITIRRIAYMANLPVFHETSYLVSPRQLDMTGIMEKPETFDYIYGFFEKNGIKIGFGKQFIGAEPASEEDCSLLNLSHGDAVLVISRLTQDESGDAVEFSEVRYCAKRYQYEVNLLRGDI